MVKHLVWSVDRPQVPYFWPSISDLVLFAGAMNAKLHHRQDVKQLEVYEACTVLANHIS